MMFKKLLLIGLVGVACLAQADVNRFQIKLGDAVLSKEIPSGSGMAPRPNGYWVVGDDSGYLFEVDAQFNVIDKTLLKDYPHDKHGRIAKKIKPDYEAMAQFDWENTRWNLIAGSGSKEEVREFAYLISADKQQRFERKLTALYQQLYTTGGLSGKQRINIEGLAVAGDYLYFLNRGNSASNMIFRVLLAEAVDYMRGRIDAVRTLRKFDVLLPVVKKYEAGLSGADFWPETNALVYTASVEASGDAYGDGEVLGSFIGLVPLESLREDKRLDLRHSAQRLKKNGNPLITKVESIALSTTGKNQIKGALVSDNDDGTSVFFDFSLRLKH